MRKNVFKALKTSKNHHEHIALVIICGLLVCQILLFYMFTSQSNNDEHIFNVSKRVSELIVEEEYDEGQTVTFVASLCTDSDILTLMEGERLSEISAISLGQRLRRDASLMGNISNIYLYIRRDDRLISLFEPNAVLNDDSSRTIAQAVHSESLTPGSFLFMTADRNNISSESRMFNIYSANIAENDLFLIELKSVKAMENYSHCQQYFGGRLIVCDDDGTVIYGGTIFKSGESISSDKIFDKRKIGNYFAMNIGGEKNLVHYDYSESLNRWYISLVPQKKLSATMFDRRFIFMYLSIIIAIFTILRCHRWFANLRQTIGLNNEEQKKRKAFLDYLTDENDGEFKRSLCPYDEIVNTACFVVRTDNYGLLLQEYSRKDMELFSFGTDNILKELGEKYGFTLYFLRVNEGNSEYVLGAKTKTDFDVKFHQFAQKAQKYLKDYIGAETSYYVSSLKTEDKVKEAYRESQEVLEYFFLYGKEKILDSKVIKENSDSALKDAKTICDEIKGCIVGFEGNEEKIYTRLTDIMRDMSVADVRETMFYLLICLYSATEVLREKNAIVTSFDVIKNLSFASGVASLDEFSDFIRKIFYDLSSQSSAPADSKLRMMVQKSYELIDELYSTEELCIAYLAARFGVTENYLGRKFKEMTGKSIPDIIREKRLSEAAKLLKETNKSVKVIMESVGYSNSSHFSASFKKSYGLTPLAYRQKTKDI